MKYKLKETIKLGTIPTMYMDMKDNHVGCKKIAIDLSIYQVYNSL